MADYLSSVLNEYGLGDNKDKEPSYLDSVLGEYGLIEPKQAETRNPFAVANDTVITAANAALGGVQAVSDFVSPGNQFSQGVEALIKEGEEKQSAVTKQGRAKLGQALESEDIGSQLSGVKDFVLQNPLQAAAMAAGSFALPGGAIKGSKLLGGALGLSEKAAGRVALGTGMGTSGVLAGGDAAGDAYQTVMNAPELAGMPIDERERIATDAARKASAVPFVLGAASGMFGAEKALATGTKSLLKTGAQEFVSEAIEEGGTKLSANIAAQQAGVDVGTFKGVAGSAALGGVLGGGTGLAIGALTKQPDSFLAGSTNISTGNISPDSNAIDKAIDANSTEIDTNTDQQLVAIRQQQVELQQAQQQAKQEADAVAAQQAQEQAQQQAAQAQEAFTSVAQTYGLQPLEVANQFNIGGKRLFSLPQATQFLSEIDKLNEGKNEEQKALIGSVLTSGAVKVPQTANTKAINNAAIKFLDTWGFGDAQTRAEAADRAEILINSLEGPKALKEADQLNSFYKSITGVNAPAYDALQIAAQPKLTEGASNEQLRLQNQGNAGLRAVSEQGGTTQASGNQPGDVRPTSVQSVQPGSVGAGSLGLQTGAVPSGRIPTSTSEDGSWTNLPSEDSRPQEAQVTSEREDAIRVVNQVITRAFGERDAKIVLEVLTKEKTQAQIAKEFGISDARVNQIAGPQAQETWGSRILLAARNMGISKEEMGNFLEMMSTEEKGLAKEAALSETEGLTEEALGPENDADILNQNLDDVNPAFSDEIPMGTTLGTEELSTGEEGTGASGFRVFNKKTSGESELEDAVDFKKNRTQRKVKENNLKNLKDHELNNLAADENTTIEELDQIVAELLRRQEVRVAKGEDNAVQERSTKGVSVRKQAEAGKRVPSKDTKERKAATESQADEEVSSLTLEEYFGTKSKLDAEYDVLQKDYDELTNQYWDLEYKPNLAEKREKIKAEREIKEKELDAKLAQLQNLEFPKVKQNIGKTNEEAAAEAWDKAAKEFPQAPKFADLTEDQQADFVSFGPDNWTAEDVQTELIKLAKEPKFSITAKPVADAWESSALTKNLKATFNTDESFSDLVTVVDVFEELPVDIQAESKKLRADPSGIKGIAYNGKVYLIASQIAKGQELGVMLHELGAHIGMKKLVGEYNYKRIIDQLERWAAGKDTALNSVEKMIVDRAYARIPKGITNSNTRRDELLAYFVEEAVLAGISPTARKVKGDSPIVQMLRSLLASMKIALRKIGFGRFDKLTVSDLVDLSFGAAKLELDGVYHGTDREFRKFNDTYITNFMSGWGHYSSNLPAETDSYGKKTIRAIPLVDRRDLIQNDRPMGDQTRIMAMLEPVLNQNTAQAKALRDFLANESIENIDGSDFQQVLGKFEVESEGGLYKMLNKTNQASVVEVEEIVSKFLEQAGILGSTFKPYGRGAPNRQTIMFAGRNLARVSQETDKGLKFSLAKAREESAKRIAILPKPIRGPLQHVADTIAEFAKKSLPYAAFTEDLADIATKYLPSAKKYVTLMKERQAIRTKFERRVDEILQKYDSLPNEVKGTGDNSVNKFLMDSTRESKWAYNPGWIKGFKEETDIDAGLEARFKALPDSAQALVKEVFAHGQSTLLAMQKAVTENINTEYDALIAAAKKSGDTKEEAELTKKKASTLTEYANLMRKNSKKPYAPLKRFGNYVIVGKSQQYIDNEAIVESKTAAPDKIAEARKELRKLEKNDLHYFVQFAETVGEAKAIVREEAGNYDYLENFEKDSSQGYGVRDLNDVFNRLRNMVEDEKDSSLSDASDKAINRLLADLKLTLLSETSARQSERRRKNIGGAEKDMMRAFATQGRATANFISSLENSGNIYDTLREMKDEARKGTEGTRADRSRYYNEFMKRHFMGMDYQPSPFVDKALSTTSMWMLLTNPAYYLQNMTQPFMMSLPVIAGKHGYARSWKEMTRAYTDIASVIRKHGITESSYSKLPEDVRNVVEVLVNRGRIDISLEQDLGRWRSTEDSKFNKFGRATELLRSMAQDIETINRVATAVAAYRLEVKRGNPTSALNYADKIIYTTHGDYSGFNAPRITRSSLGRLATQFRKFQLIQISLITRLFNDAFVNEHPDVRLAGKYSLAYTIGHTAVMGGIMGLPGFYAAAALYGMLFGDDDEPDNPELALRRAIGDETIADLLVKGVPAAMGVDLSGKLGMGQMLSALPYSDVNLSRKGVYETIGTIVSGPFGGLLAKSADGVSLMAGGDYQKGLEQLLPTGLANVAKAYRFGTEGVTTRAGDVVMNADDIGFVDQFFTALGLPTDTLTDRNFLNAAKFEYDQFYNDKASEIKRAYTRAYKEGDTAALNEAREAWKSLQESRARNSYQRQPLSTLLKAPQEQKKRERQSVGGVQFNKANRGFVRTTSEL